MHLVARQFLPKCNHCDDRSWNIFCGSCEALLRFKSHCLSCGVRCVGKHQSYCPNCRTKKASWNRFYTSYFYDGGVREWILDMKSRGNPERLRELQRFQLPTDFRNYDVLVSVPSDPAKNIQRSYVFSELLGKRLSKLLRVPYKESVFLRKEFLTSQKKLSRSERFFYLQKCISLTQGISLKPKTRVLLVDDVFTTGASMSLCARLLVERGIEVDAYSLSFQIKRLSHLAISQKIGKTRQQ